MISYCKYVIVLISLYSTNTHNYNIIAVIFSLSRYSPITSVYNCLPRRYESIRSPVFKMNTIRIGIFVWSNTYLHIGRDNNIFIKYLILVKFKKYVDQLQFDYSKIRFTFYRFLDLSYK